VLGLIFAFALGGVAGFAYARWLAANAVPDAPPAIAPPDVGPIEPVVTAIAKPNKRAQKVGLTEADFTPSDDILERLRLAEAGQLDPATLDAEAKAKADAEEKADAEAKARADAKSEAKARAKADADAAEAAAAAVALAEAERRVLDRLRRMADGETDDGDGDADDATDDATEAEPTA
jgi:hypothetical protein